MGWSATDSACRTMERIEDKCLQLSGCCNVFVSRSGKFFIEVGDEQEDGSIRGEIVNYFTGRVAGKLHIAPNGELKKAIYLKRLMK